MREPCVVDADVVSSVVRRDARAAIFRPHLADRPVIVSSVTLAELDRWGIKRFWGRARVRRLERKPGRFGPEMPDRDLRRVWTAVARGARRPGRPVQTADARIGATALRPGVPRITHNRDDDAGAPGLDPVSF